MRGIPRTVVQGLNPLHSLSLHSLGLAAGSIQWFSLHMLPASNVFSATHYLALLKHSLLLFEKNVNTEIGRIIEILKNY